ncbi:HAD family acid phosphatase [Saccharopolyspora rosea]|uniref:HAD family acid phosphatase n=1 Tax=Saccharopolyspora rosea TaxID=524884 RepID=A0ABW3FUX3_9PSEU|nr:HAD family acid phosphatase [Saccharopolyspora rosea]
MPSRAIRVCLATVAAAGLVGAGSALAAPPTGTGTEPTNLTDAKNAVERYHDSGAWDRDLAGVDQQARDFVQRRLHDGVTKPAIVLDIDDTALSTYDFEKQHDFGYDSGAFDEYAKDRKFTAIGPTRDLVRYAHDNGVAVFFVTGRREDPELRQATAANLTEQGYPAPNGLYLRPVDDDAPSAVPYKSGTRAEIEKQGYDVLLSIGDQRSDLDGGHAERGFKLPNPMYSLP